MDRLADRPTFVPGAATIASRRRPVSPPARTDGSQMSASTSDPRRASASDDALPPETLSEAPPFRPEEWPFHWINRTNGRYFQVMEKALKPLGLDMALWRVLMFLDEVGPRSIGEIADICLIKLSTTTKIVQRLQADDLVSCRPGRHDARVTEVRLTPHGKERQMQVRAAVDQLFARTFDGIDPARVAEANRVLAEICDHLDAL